MPEFNDLKQPPPAVAPGAAIKVALLLCSY